MDQCLPIYKRKNFIRSVIKTRCLALFPLLLFLFVGAALSAQPVITARFANPQYNCDNGEYCLDVEFQSDTPGQEIFGINLRFFYDQGQLTLINTRDFQGGYTGAGGANPYVPPANNLASGAGPVLFNFTHPTATFVNGSISKTNSGATPIFVSTTGWTKLFQVCFSVDDPGADLDNFCPNIVWDLEFDPANGGFPAGDDGLVITVVNPDPNFDSSPTIENVEQFNWEYFDPGQTTVPPFGFLTEDVCISTRCIDVSIDIEVDNAMPASGNQVVFTVTLANAAGFDDAENILVDVPLPSGFTSLIDNGGGSYDQGTGTWAVSSLASGSTTVLQITATYSGGGPYTVLAEVISHDGTDVDSEPGNGVDTNGNTIVENDDDPVTGDEDDGDGVVITPVSGSISVTKEDISIGLGLDNTLNEGDVINYTITVTNTGDVTINNLSVSDPGADGPITCLATTLPVGESTTCSATHTITQADLDAGSFTNQATVDGEDPFGNPVTDTSDDPGDLTDNDANGDGEPDDPTVTTLQQNPAISLEKAGTWNDDGDGIAEVGETITYAFTVTNTGNVALTNITVSDPTPGVSVSGGPLASLAPGASDNSTFTASYTLTQADIDAGSFSNQATATGDDPNGSPVEDTASDDPATPAADDPTVTPLPQYPELTVTKTDALDLGPNGLPDEGDVITYIITVMNTGNVTVSGITISDPNADMGSINCSPAEAFTLAPGQSATCSAIHTLTQADIDSRIISNQAFANGIDPNGQPVTDESDDPDTQGPNDPTITELPCVTIEAWVYLEGAAIFSDGSENYALPMRTGLNDLRLLPGQTLEDLFLGVQYTPAGQPYDIAPWNYFGTEGDAYDSAGDPLFGDAGYPSTVVDWVLVSLRDNPNGAGGPICQAAALLHEDGSIQFVDDFECCNIDLGQSYYLVIEHRNHLIVMSHEPIAIVGGVISYDFRVQQSYLVDPFGFGYVGQKEILPGVWAMHGGNGNQTLSGDSDTDINFDDRTYWEAENGDIAKYRIGDYNLNGDTNFNDRRVWELNNGKFTSVPRD
ncbi:MAG: DUF11 domain-containing protein [Phaeodactylibacter sp.]|nr:DUF11 domain-containing protein [Phaeodactylibacter sp.]